MRNSSSGTVGSSLRTDWSILKLCGFQQAEQHGFTDLETGNTEQRDVFRNPDDHSLCCTFTVLMFLCCKLWMQLDLQLYNTKYSAKLPDDLL